MHFLNIKKYKFLKPVMSKQFGESAVVIPSKTEVSLYSACHVVHWRNNPDNLQSLLEQSNFIQRKFGIFKREFVEFTMLM